MKILAAVDGSPCTREVIRELGSRLWPSGTEIRILSVVHPLPWFHDPFQVGAAFYVWSKEEAEKRTTAIVGEVSGMLAEKVPDLRVSTRILEGSPKERIVEEAEHWGADLVLIGTHGYGPAKRFLLGSVAHAVALHAPCSVEIVRHCPATEPA